jgi:hypothetical protein
MNKQSAAQNTHSLTLSAVSLVKIFFLKARIIIDMTTLRCSNRRIEAIHFAKPIIFVELHHGSPRMTLFLSKP